LPSLSTLPEAFQSSVELSGDIIAERLLRVSTSNVILFYLKIGSHQLTGMVMADFETVNVMFTTWKPKFYFDSVNYFLAKAFSFFLFC
jgi:hypothetical protein